MNNSHDFLILIAAILPVLMLPAVFEASRTARVPPPTDGEDSAAYRPSINRAADITLCSLIIAAAEVCALIGIARQPNRFEDVAAWVGLGAAFWLLGGTYLPLLGRQLWSYKQASGRGVGIMLISRTLGLVLLAAAGYAITTAGTHDHAQRPFGPQFGQRFGPGQPGVPDFRRFPGGPGMGTSCFYGVRPGATPASPVPRVYGGSPPSASTCPGVPILPGIRPTAAPGTVPTLRPSGLPVPFPTHSLNRQPAHG